MSTPAYPLAWPVGWKRTQPGDRVPGHFGTRKASMPGGYKMLRDITIAEATDRLLSEMIRMGIPRNDIVVSTNLVLRMDGLPRSEQRAPADPGAAVYWRDGAHQRCMAIDRYRSVEDNLAAIAATIEAMRAIERHGGAVILDRAFAGFAALPAPGARSWREVLGFMNEDRPSLAAVKERYRRIASESHPDKHPDDPEAARRMVDINRAWEEAQEALR